MSTPSGRGSVWVFATFVLLFLPPMAAGQSVAPAQTAIDNVAAVGARAPGNMVSAGVAEAIDFGNRAFSGTVITEPANNNSFRIDAITGSLEVLFEQLNIAIIAFHALLRERAGLSPVLPTTLRTKDLSTDTVKPGRLASPERIELRRNSRADVKRR